MFAKKNGKERVPKKVDALFLRKKKVPKKYRMRSNHLRTLFFLKKRALTFLERVSCVSYREQRRTYSTPS